MNLCLFHFKHCVTLTFPYLLQKVLHELVLSVYESQNVSITWDCPYPNKYHTQWKDDMIWGGVLSLKLSQLYKIPFEIRFKTVSKVPHNEWGGGEWRVYLKAESNKP